MKNMDKGLTVTKWVLVVRPKILTDGLGHSLFQNGC